MTGLDLDTVRVARDASCSSRFGVVSISRAGSLVPFATAGRTRVRWITPMSTPLEDTDDASCCLPRYLSAGEAGAYLRLSLSWIRKATRAGTIPCARIGTRVVYDRLDLDAWVAARKRAAAYDLPCATGVPRS